MATPEDGRLAVYLTVLPAGNGSPPSHRPMYGCHILSRVLAGEVEQVRITTRMCVCVVRGVGPNFFFESRENCSR